MLEIDGLQIAPNNHDDYEAVEPTPPKKKKKEEPLEVNTTEFHETEASAYDEEDRPDFVWQAMRRAFDPVTNTVRDLKVDDSDLEMAENYFHFCDKIAGKSIKLPFSRQLWIAYNLMSEYCPRCTPKQYASIDSVPVDMDPRDLVKKVTLLKKGVCPKCKAIKSKLILSKELTDYNQLVMIAGQRGGKSAFSSTISGYHTHLMFKAPRLSSICRGIQDFTPLTGTFVALTTGRAIKLLWNPFSTLVDSSEWFQNYFKMLDFYGKKYSKEFYKKRDLFIRNFHKNLDYYPMGPMKRTLRGDTRCIASTDELGWFPYKLNKSMQDEDEDGLIEDSQEDEREMANGDEVHQALDNSLSTLRTEVYDLYKRNIHTVPTGFNLNISSPKSWQDKICRLFKESADPTALSLGVHLPTWGINPLYSKDHPIIVAAYSKNRRRAERDFGANPPKNAENVFDKNMVRASFKGKQHHKIEMDETEEGVSHPVLKTLIQRNKWRATVMGIDAGFNDNSFALTIGSREGETIVAHSVLEIIPSKSNPIHFPTVYKRIILPLVKECNTVYVGADRWNSIHLLQQVEEDTKGRTKWVQVTLNAEDFSLFVQMANSGNLILPETTADFDAIESVINYKNAMRFLPVDHLYLQFTTVETKDNIILKGEGFTDDVFRSLVVMSTMQFIPKVRKYVNECAPAERSGVSPRSAVLVGGRSGGVYTPFFNQPVDTKDPDYY